MAGFALKTLFTLHRRRILAGIAIPLALALSATGCNAKANGTAGQSSCGATSSDIDGRINDKKAYVSVPDSDGGKATYAEAFVLNSKSNRGRYFIVCVHNFRNQQQRYVVTAYVDAHQITKTFDFTYGPNRFASFSVLVLYPGCLDLNIEVERKKPVDKTTQKLVCPKKPKG